VEGEVALGVILLLVVLGAPFEEDLHSGDQSGVLIQNLHEEDGAQVHPVPEAHRRERSLHHDQDQGLRVDLLLDLEADRGQAVGVDPNLSNMMVKNSENSFRHRSFLV